MWLSVDLRADNEKNKNKNMHLKEIGLHAQNMLTILGSIVNVSGETLYDHLMSTRIFTLITNKIFT